MSQGPTLVITGVLGNWISSPVSIGSNTYSGYWDASPEPTPERLARENKEMRDRKHALLAEIKDLTNIIGT